VDDCVGRKIRVVNESVGIWNEAVATVPPGRHEHQELLEDEEVFHGELLGSLDGTRDRVIAAGALQPCADEFVRALQLLRHVRRRCSKQQPIALVPPLILIEEIHSGYGESTVTRSPSPLCKAGEDDSATRLIGVHVDDRRAVEEGEEAHSNIVKLLAKPRGVGGVAGSHGVLDLAVGGSTKET
jgi:hypothetical protein